MPNKSMINNQSRFIEVENVQLLTRANGGLHS